MNQDFPIRMGNQAAPERNETGGEESRKWLTSKILGKEVDIIVNPKNRVGKWGRLLGRIISGGIDVGEESIAMGHATTWENRKTNPFQSMEALL